MPFAPVGESSRMTEHSRENVTVWEYKLVPMGNPLEPGIEERANAFGHQGWDLVAIDAGVWIFKRPRPEDPAEEEPLRALLEQTVPLTEDLAAEAISEAPATAELLEPELPARLS